MLGFPGGTCLSVQEMARNGFNPCIGKIPWRRAWQPTPVFSPTESQDRGAWQTTVHGVAMSQT